MYAKIGIDFRESIVSKKCGDIHGHVQGNLKDIKTNVNVKCYGMLITYKNVSSTALACVRQM